MGLAVSERPMSPLYQAQIESRDVALGIQTP